MAETHEWTPEQSQEAIRKVLARAATDDEFRRKALADPNAAVVEATGKALPEGYRLRFVDNDGADCTVVVPDQPAGEELSDEDIERLAGGVSFAAQKSPIQLSKTPGPPAPFVPTPLPNIGKASRRR